MYFLLNFYWTQGVEIIRGCRGLNLVGCDLVEVSPPYDTTGTFVTLLSLYNHYWWYFNFDVWFYSFKQETLHWLGPTSSLKCCVSCQRLNTTDLNRTRFTFNGVHICPWQQAVFFIAQYYKKNKLTVLNFNMKQFCAIIRYD